MDDTTERDRCIKELPTPRKEEGYCEELSRRSVDVDMSLTRIETSEMIESKNISNEIVKPANKEEVSNKDGSVSGDVDLIQTDEKVEIEQAREEKVMPLKKQEGSTEPKYGSGDIYLTLTGKSDESYQSAKAVVVLDKEEVDSKGYSSRSDDVDMARITKISDIISKVKCLRNKQ